MLAIGILGRFGDIPEYEQLLLPGSVLIFAGIVMLIYMKIRQDRKIKEIIRSHRGKVKKGTTSNSEKKEEDRARIFEKYDRLDERDTGVKRGLGLGLAFCKMAVEAHHGSIWVEGRNGGGSAFIFTIPIE